MGNTYRKIYSTDLFSRRNNGLHIVSNGNMPIVGEYTIGVGWRSHLTGNPIPADRSSYFYASTVGLKGPSKFRTKYRKYSGNYSSKLFGNKFLVLTDGNKYYTAYSTSNGFVSTDTCDIIDMTTIHSYDVLNWTYPHVPIVRECIVPPPAPVGISGTLNSGVFNGATPAFNLSVTDPTFVSQLEAAYPFLTSLASGDSGSITFSLTNGVDTYGGTVNIQYVVGVGYEFESSLGDPILLTIFAPLTSSDFVLFDNTWTLSITNLSI